MTPSRALRTLAAIAFTALVVAQPSAALADAGVGIDPGKITGLPPVELDTATTVAVTVRNPGSDAASYQMLAQPLGGEPELPIDPTWFRFEPATFDLAGSAAREVRVTFTVPEGTGAGDYLALVTAQLVLGDAESSGAQVGAAVATKLFFTVPNAPTSSSSVPIGLVVVAVAVAAVVAAWVVWRKSGIRLSVSRDR